MRVFRKLGVLCRSLLRSRGNYRQRPSIQDNPGTHFVADDCLSEGRNDNCFWRYEHRSQTRLKSESKHVFSLLPHPHVLSAVGQCTMGLLRLCPGTVAGVLPSAASRFTKRCGGRYQARIVRIRISVRRADTRERQRSSTRNATHRMDNWIFLLRF